MYLSLRKRPHASISFLSPELCRKGRTSTLHPICFFLWKKQLLESTRSGSPLLAEPQRITTTIWTPLPHPTSNTLPQSQAQKSNLGRHGAPKTLKNPLLSSVASQPSRTSLADSTSFPYACSPCLAVERHNTASELGK